jgi:hypothetical protein
MSRINQNFADVENSIMSMVQGSTLNGKVDLLSAMPSFNIPSYQQQSVNNKNYAKEAVSGMITLTPVSDLYFSEKNIEALQQGIRYRVYVETSGKYVIGRQSDQELKVVMRSMYFQYGVNTAGNTVGQVRVLNGKVLDWVVPEVMSNILQYATYRRDASTLPMPIDRAPLVSSKGTKVLEIKSFM